MKKYDLFLRAVGPVASLAVPLSRSPMTWASPDDRASVALSTSFSASRNDRKSARDDGGVGSARGRRCAHVHDLKRSWPVRLCDINDRFWDIVMALFPPITRNFHRNHLVTLQLFC